MQKKMFLGYVLVALSAVIFGCMPLMAKKFIYPDGINAPSLVFWRNFLALPVLGVLAFRENKTVKVSVKALPSLCVTALLGCCITPVLLFTSYNYIPSGTATVFHFIYPAAVVVGGLLFCNKKAQAASIVSVIMCVAGICLFYDPAAPLDITGAVIAAASGITFSAYVLLLSQGKMRVTGFLFTFYIALISSIAIFLYCIFTGNFVIPSSPLTFAYCAVFALAVTVGAVVLFQNGTVIIGGERASVISTLEPITGVVIGAAVFSEKLSIGVIAGSVLIIAATVTIALSDMKKTR